MAAGLSTLRGRCNGAAERGNLASECTQADARVPQPRVEFIEQSKRLPVLREGLVRMRFCEQASECRGVRWTEGSLRSHVRGFRDRERLRVFSFGWSGCEQRGQRGARMERREVARTELLRRGGDAGARERNRLFRLAAHAQAYDEFEQCVDRALSLCAHRCHASVVGGA